MLDGGVTHEERWIGLGLAELTIRDRVEPERTRACVKRRPPITLVRDLQTKRVTVEAYRPAHVTNIENDLHELHVSIVRL